VDGSTLRALDPEIRAVIEAVPMWSGASRVEVSPIPGGITNRNFRVDVDGASFVVRVPGADTEQLGIDRRVERRAAEAGAATGVGPEVVAYLPDRRVLVTRFIEGRPIPEDAMRDPGNLGPVVGALKALHRGPDLPGAFSPFRVVERYRDVADAHGVRVPDAYEPLHRMAADIERALGGFTPRPCHNDLLNANFIRSGDRVFIVDYEYAGMGDPYFDLANLSVNHGFDDDADDLLQELYFGGVTGERTGRLKLMKVMSDFREGMWGVVQQGISALDFDYVDYADRHLERCRRHGEDARLRSWLGAAARGR
jgi:thiamine kinase-like enzyme